MPAMAQSTRREGIRYCGKRFGVAQAECEMIGGVKYHIHRWCPYTGYGEIVVGSDIAKNRLMRLAILALGVTPWALVIVIDGVPK